MSLEVAMFRTANLSLFCRCDRSDNDLHMSHEAICCSKLSRRCVAAICRIVCLGLYSSLTRGFAKYISFVTLFAIDVTDPQFQSFMFYP